MLKFTINMNHGIEGMIGFPILTAGHPDFKVLFYVTISDVQYVVFYL